MPVIGITGGIASGKSTVARWLVEKLEKNGAATVAGFSADECAHELLETDPGVREQIQQQFGDEVFLPDGEINRPALRKIVFADPERRSELEVILHPKIHQTWMEKAKDFRSSTCYLVAEIPLLYETKSEDYFDSIVVVEADAQVQLERLSSKRGWSLETARQVIDAQMPAAEKMRRANILILNHHTEKLLASQVNLAARALLLQYA